MFKYFQRRKKRKLYQQWVDRASLSPDALPREEVAEDRISPRNRQLIPQGQADRQQSYLTILYILLGVALVVLAAGLVFLIVLSS